MCPRDPALRPPHEVLGAGVVTGAIAGLAAGLIDALWSWGPAAQFVPGVARLRFVLFSGALHAAAGAAAGACLTLLLLVLSRGSRIGDLLRFGWREHVARRAQDPRTALAGLGISIALLPCLALALWLAYRATVPYITGRKELALVVIVAMVATLVAVGAAIAVAFVLGRALEALLARAARVPSVGRALSSPYAPLVAAGGLAAIALAAWAHRSWETARVLPLRGPLVIAAGLALAVPATGLARSALARLAARRAAVRRAAWIAGPITLAALVLVLGDSAAVIKSASAYTGLGGPVARTLRRGFDWDRDGYARFLGGGDCDDGDRTVHPGAPERPDDGVDQNCVGGDASARPIVEDAAFAPVPPGLPSDFRVLLITIDTIRADHVGAYGYARATTPHLDALARTGALFEHGWAHAPSTRYSIPAILTGRLPLDVRYDTTVEGWPGLAPAALTIAEALDPLGFTARGAITNYWYFDKSRHMDQGTTEYDNDNARLHSGVAGAGPEQTRGSSSREQTDKALAFVERNAAARWFLWVHYYDPHYAYEPHAEVPPFGTDRIARYDGELAFTDAQIGRLLDGLRAKGQADRTVVVVTGDHGEGFGEHGVELHGYHLYAAQTKVPLIVRVPGVAPRRAQLPAGHIDILPTLVNLAGGAPNPELQGRSLVDAITGAPGADRDRVVFQQLSYEGDHELRGGASQRCHAIYNVSPDPSWEVYRTDSDPRETTDVAGDAAACAETRGAVERWFDAEQIPRGAAAALLAARPAIAAPLDADLGPSVRLLSVDAPATIKAGSLVSLTWTFECRGAVAAGWRVFAHLEGPAKGAFINGDHTPARPFEWWEPGQYIRYTTTVAIPRHARGRYTVWAGLFRGKVRAPAAAPKARIENRAVAAATIEVIP